MQVAIGDFWWLKKTNQKTKTKTLLQKYKKKINALTTEGCHKSDFSLKTLKMLKKKTKTKQKQKQSNKQTINK